MGWRNIRRCLKKLILIAPEGREKEAIIRLSRVGFDNVIGYLEGGINSWIKNGGIINKVLNESASKFSTIEIIKISLM